MQEWTRAGRMSSIPTHPPALALPRRPLPPLKRPRLPPLPLPPPPLLRLMSRCAAPRPARTACPPVPAPAAGPPALRRQQTWRPPAPPAQLPPPPAQKPVRRGRGEILSESMGVRNAAGRSAIYGSLAVQSTSAAGRMASGWPGAAAVPTAAPAAAPAAATCCCYSCCSSPLRPTPLGACLSAAAAPRARAPAALPAAPAARHFPTAPAPRLQQRQQKRHVRAQVVARRRQQCSQCRCRAALRGSSTAASRSMHSRASTTIAAHAGARNQPAEGTLAPTQLRLLLLLAQLLAGSHPALRQVIVLQGQEGQARYCCSAHCRLVLPSARSLRSQRQCSVGHGRQGAVVKCASLCSAGSGSG